MGDEVDALVEAWRTQRADLALEPMQVWSRIDRLARVLADRRKVVFQSQGIEGWEFDVLAALRRAGAPHRLTPGQLVRETYVSSGTMTHRVDRLVERALVTRASDPSDGRSVLVELTPVGLKVVDAALEGLVTVEAQLLSGVSDTKRDQLSDELRRLLSGC